jgi:hypothetical protein
MQPVRVQVIEDIGIQNGTVLDTTTGTEVDLDAASICEEDRTTQVIGDILCWITPLDVTGGGIKLSPGDFTADNGTSVDLMDTSAMININRLGWWNVGRWLSSTCLRGNVNDGFGTIVPNAQIKCAGVDYQGMSYAYSAVNGTFCTRTKPDSQYSCVIRKAAFQSDPFVGTSPNNTNKCSSETSCANVGQVDLTNPLARAIMSWGEEPEDLDMHFVGDGIQIYFNNKDYTQFWQKGSVTSQPYILLDTDDTTGFGPEILTIVRGVNAGIYYYCVHNFSGQANGTLEDSGATVQYFTDTTSRKFDVPTSNPNNYNVWRVFKLVIDSNDNLTLTEINEFADGSSSVDDACQRNQIPL